MVKMNLVFVYLYIFEGIFTIILLFFLDINDVFHFLCSKKNFTLLVIISDANEFYFISFSDSVKINKKGTPLESTFSSFLTLENENIAK